jgi:hypothetical protein
MLLRQALTNNELIKHKTQIIMASIMLPQGASCMLPLQALNNN